MKPMLAATCASPVGLSYPLLASPKLDGVRAVVQNGVLVSRSIKPIRNRHVRSLFSLPQVTGLDGELVLGDHDATVFRRTQSAQSAIEGTPDMTFWVFDVQGMSIPFRARYDYLHTLTLPSIVKIVPHVWIHNAVELLRYEEKCLADGYEGIMLRCPNGPYKEGRSTLNEGYLMKVKRFEDAEAEIIGFEERMHNGNTATTNALGHTERSSHQANMVGRCDLGALVVRGINGLYKDAVFNIGTGFDDVDRDGIWKSRDLALGKTVKYKFFPSGSKDKPRFPVYLGFRDLGA